MQPSCDNAYWDELARQISCGSLSLQELSPHTREVVMAAMNDLVKRPVKPRSGIVDMEF